MGDEQLRALERVAQHDPLARAGLLRERVRAGVVTREALGMAAFLGDGKARLAVPYRSVGGVPGSWTCVDAFGLTHWLHGLHSVAPPGLGKIVMARATVAVMWEAHHCGLICMGTMDEHRVITATENWILCPCDKHLVGVLHLHDFQEARWYSSVWAVMGRSELWAAGMTRFRWVAETTLRACIRDALVPWCLGDRDPVADWVARRPEPIDEPPGVGVHHLPGHEPGHRAPEPV